MKVVKFDPKTVRLQEVSSRLWALEFAFYEDYGKSMNLDSRTAFETFMRYNEKIQIPLIGLESTGLLVATWRREQKSLVIRFKDRYRMDWVLADPLWGSKGVTSLVTFLEDHPDWTPLLFP